MLYVLGVKQADIYLPTEDEVMEMAKQAKAASAQQQPSPMDAADIAAKQARAAVDQARAGQIQSDVNGNDAKRQLEGYSLVKEHKARAF